MTTPRARLRVIRENAQALQRTLSRLGGTDEEFDARFESEERLWNENAGDIDRDLETLRTELERGDVKMEIDDDVEFVRNAWGEAKEGWTALLGDRATGDARRARIPVVDERLAAMVLKIGYLTIPARVAEFVARERTGGVFHFHAAFTNELPVLADRVAILTYLAESPGGLYGIVDVKAGLVWAVSPNAWRRSRGYLGAALIVAVGFLVAWFSHEIATALGVTAAFAERANVVQTYVLVALGVVGHIGVDIYKQSRTEAADSPTPMEDLILWGHVHEKQLYLTAFGLWAGTALLVVAFNPVDWATAALAGYSLDSVLDAGIMRFETTVTKSTKDLTDKLKAAAPA